MGDTVANIFAADLYQVGQGSQAQANNFVVDRVDVTKGRDMDHVTKERNVSFKGTVAGNYSTDQLSGPAVSELNLIKPLS